MKISPSFWRFPGSEWESATLSPNFHFFHLQLHFFSFFLCFWWFSIVFHWFSWFCWISGATGKENEKKHHKKMKISSSFWKFPGSEWESATLSPNFHFFHLQLHFFSFSFVFDGLPFFCVDFHGFPGFQVPRARNMKKMKFEMKKWCLKWKKWSLKEPKNEKKIKKMKNKWKQKNDSKTKWKKWSYKWKPNEK